jgi:hypothetical protein
MAYSMQAYQKELSTIYAKIMRKFLRLSFNKGLLRIPKEKFRPTLTRPAPS